MQNLTEFKFDCRHPVRVLDRDGQAWFVLSDVCSALAIANNRHAATRLDEDEKGVVNSDTLGGPQALTVVNEAGLYSLILTSRKPEAKQFKRWVTHEVLPTLRRTGAYEPVTAVDPMLRAVAFLLDHQLRILHATTVLANAEGITQVLKLPGATGLSIEKVRRTLSLFEVLGLVRWVDHEHVHIGEPVTGRGVWR